MKTVAVLNQKGGSGKTTISTNLACAFRKLYDLDVAIIDADPQGTASEWAARSEDSPPVYGANEPTIHEDLPALTDAFDVTIIDGAPALEEMATSAIKATDLVLIPVQPSGADIWSASDILELVEARQSVTGGPHAAFVVSRAIVGTNLAGSAADALDSLSASVMNSRTAQRVAYTEALGAGLSVLDVDGGKAAGEIRDLADETLALLQKS
jgi:chromosome partitioning protein